MTRGVRLYLVGSFVLVSLASCGRGFFSAEREPWRAEAEIACLKSGAVKESAEIVRIDPISGPGMCGADYPLKVAALGESSGSFGFADEDLRPPAMIGNQPRWPIQQPRPAAPQISTYPRASTYPQTYPDNAVRGPGYPAPPGAPISLSAPGVAVDEDDINLPPEGVPGARPPIGRAPYPATPAYPPADGRRIAVKDGWRGLPEEQGFLRDVQAAACQQFSTVLAPGSNVYHYDHIHVDLMRRASRRVICEPQAVSGEEIAARAGARNPYASREPNVTGSLAASKTASHRRRAKIDEEDE